MCGKVISTLSIVKSLLDFSRIIFFRIAPSHFTELATIDDCFMFGTSISTLDL